MSNLNGKVIVVIGGTTGLGLSAAQAFVERGAKVVVVGRDVNNVKSAEQTLGAASRAMSGDASDPATAPRAIELAIQSFGGFHGLYHVAGGSGRRKGDGPLHEISDEGWAYTINLNLTSIFYSNRAAARQFLQQGAGGSILNMGSVLGFSPSPRYFTTHAYAAAPPTTPTRTSASTSSPPRSSKPPWPSGRPTTRSSSSSSKPNNPSTAEESANPRTSTPRPRSSSPTIRNSSPAKSSLSTAAGR
jgi:hypothetical protein